MTYLRNCLRRPTEETICGKKTFENFTDALKLLNETYGNHKVTSSKHFLFSKTSWRRLKDVLIKSYHNVLKTTWRLQRNNFLSSKTSSKDVFKSTSRCLLKTSLRSPLDVFNTSSRCPPRRLLQEFFKTSLRRYLANTCWRRNVTLKTSSTCLQHIFNTSSALFHQDECLLGY